MFVDLDHFKPVNDACGHAVGDNLLIAATERMRECLRESDTLARRRRRVRVLLPHRQPRRRPPGDPSAFIASIALPFQIGPHQIDISASIGICIFPEHAGDEVGLMKCADTAMYQAKDAGRDRLFFADEALTRRPRAGGISVQTGSEARPAWPPTRGPASAARPAGGCRPSPEAVGAQVAPGGHHRHPMYGVEGLDLPRRHDDRRLADLHADPLRRPGVASSSLPPFTTITR